MSNSSVDVVSARRGYSRSMTPDSAAFDIAESPEVYRSRAQSAIESVAKSYEVFRILAPWHIIDLFIALALPALGKWYASHTLSRQPTSPLQPHHR